MGVVILGPILTVAGFLFFQRMIVLYYCAARDIPAPVYMFRFVFKIGAIFFGLALLGSIVNH